MDNLIRLMRKFDDENFLVFEIYNNQSFMIKICVVGTFSRFFKAFIRTETTFIDTLF